MRTIYRRPGAADRAVWRRPGPGGRRPSETAGYRARRPRRWRAPARRAGAGCRAGGVVRIGRDCRRRRAADIGSGHSVHRRVRVARRHRLRPGGARISHGRDAGRNPGGRPPPVPGLHAGGAAAADRHRRLVAGRPAAGGDAHLVERRRLVPAGHYARPGHGGGVGRRSLGGTRLHAGLDPPGMARSAVAASPFLRERLVREPDGHGARWRSGPRRRWSATAWRSRAAS